MNLAHLAWPFFDDRHRALAHALAADLATWHDTSLEALSTKAFIGLIEEFSSMADWPGKS